MAILVATIIDQSKALADKRGDASVTDPDWLAYVNWAVKSLYRTLISLDPAAYFSQGDFSLAGGVSGATFDAGTLTGFVALHGLDLSPDTGNRRTVPRRSFAERNHGKLGWWVPTLPAADRAYDLRGRSLVVTPYEQAAGTYRAYYRAGPYLFTAANDSNPLDWQLEPYDEYLALLSARRALGIEESDTGAGSERLAELRQEIIDEHARDDGAPAVIADVEDDVAGGW